MAPIIECPRCGERIETDSDEGYIICPHCNRRIKNPLSLFGT